MPPERSPLPYQRMVSSHQVYDGMQETTIYNREDWDQSQVLYCCQNLEAAISAEANFQ